MLQSNANAITKPAVVVTGASSGIGYTTAIYLANNGFHVFAGVRKTTDSERLKKLALDNLTPLLLDVTDNDSRISAAAEVQNLVGANGLYGLVNNAGMALCSPLEFASQAHVEQQIQTNYIGPLMTTQAFLPLLRQAKGRVINVSSGVGKLAVPLMGAYSSSKFALEGMTDALRVELRQWGMHVCLVVPGFVTTSIHDKNDKDMLTLLENLPESGKTYYSDAINHYIRQTHKMSTSAATTDTAARVIQKALTAEKPKSRYPIGKDAALLGMIQRIMPDRLKDAIVGKISGL